MILLMMFSLAEAQVYTREDFFFSRTWKTPPKVIEICDELPTSKEMVEESIDFWIEYQVLEKKIEVRVIKDCSEEYHKDAIVITKQKNFDIDMYYGMTFLDDWNGTIRAARIEIDPKQYDNIILIMHELGHAFGISHNKNDEHHIMYPKVLSYPTRI